MRGAAGFELDRIPNFGERRDGEEKEKMEKMVMFGFPNDLC